MYLVTLADVEANDDDDDEPMIGGTILLLTVESQFAPDATPHRLSGCCCDL